MEWVRGEILGHGSFGTVNLAKRRKISPDGRSDLMAVKSCGLSQISSLRNEKSILDKFKDCPEIIKCYGDCDSLENGEKLYNVLLEYASGGTLFDKMKNCVDRRLQEGDVRRYVKSILKGLDRIHMNGYVHCDIKLQNILLNEYGEIKIADFGLAKKAGGKADSDLRGTPMYMSPEMVVGGSQESPADIWAVGCLIVEMLNGAPVWDCTDLSGLLMKIGADELAPEIPAKLSEDGKDFIQCCFIKDPKKRWTAEMLLRHPFISVSDDRDRHCYEIKITSTSPTSGLDFSNWVSDQSTFTPSITPLTSPKGPTDSFSWFSGGGSNSNSAAERLRRLVGDQEPGWSCSDDWITIR